MAETPAPGPGDFIDLAQLAYGLSDITAGQGDVALTNTFIGIEQQARFQAFAAQYPTVEALAASGQLPEGIAPEDVYQACQLVTGQVPPDMELQVSMDLGSRYTQDQLKLMWSFLGPEF